MKTIQSPNFILRLEILRDIRDHYDTARKWKHTSATENMLYSLKIAECETMLRELMSSDIKDKEKK